jgi:hypothetical protein
LELGELGGDGGRRRLGGRGRGGGVGLLLLTVAHLDRDRRGSRGGGREHFGVFERLVAGVLCARPRQASI